MPEDYKYDEKTGTYIPVNDSEEEQHQISDDDKLIGIGLWAIQFLSSMFWPLIVSIIAYVYYQDKSKYLFETAKETLNFQISLFIYGIITIVLSFVIIGFVLIPVLIVYGIAIPILGILRAADKKIYIPQFTIRFIK